MGAASAAVSVNVAVGEGVWARDARGRSSQAWAGAGRGAGVCGLRHPCLKSNCQLPPGETTCSRANGGPGTASFLPRCPGQGQGPSHAMLGPPVGGSGADRMEDTGPRGQVWKSGMLCGDLGRSEMGSRDTCIPVLATDSMVTGPRKLHLSHGTERGFEMNLTARPEEASL